MATGRGVADRRVAGHGVIKRLLAERRDMLVLFCQVAGLDPFDCGAAECDMLQSFCEILVDYMAAAHFSLYRRLIDGSERRQAVVALGAEIYGRIEACTETAVQFNDKYAKSGEPADAADLHADLSALGEAIATRIELEDRLIAALAGGAQAARSSDA
ncbi:Rsd/AlgQ family anti-sigma factor [Acidiferrobacter sp.]|uniref:Rsd/AlgQ family anti-sigma factor n=1 Tax=Acidiferrobacter sp. TaxID=1872107 RepID=UPI0026254EC4|nr:Rsd/AlgQ family anti-sigma factor [Acidiferrobacter sp.]